MTVSSAQNKQMEDGKKAKRGREADEEEEEDSDDEEEEGPEKKKGKAVAEDDDGEFRFCCDRRGESDVSRQTPWRRIPTRRHLLQTARLSGQQQRRRETSRTRSSSSRVSL